MSFSALPAFAGATAALEEWTCIRCALAAEPILELKNRKKFEPTSMALLAFSTSSITWLDVIPLLPSAAGQSLCDKTSTGRTSHQIGWVVTRELSTTWL